MGIFIGDNTQINDIDLGWNNEHQTATLLDGGGRLVVWHSAGDADHPSGYYQQIYDSEGNPVGDATLAAASTPLVSSWSHEMALAALPSGGWVMTWKADGGGIGQQLFSASGSPLLSDTVVSSSDATEYPAIARTTDGWVVAWEDFHSGLMQQAYDENGEKIGSATLVMADAFLSLSGARVTALKSGGWVVTGATIDGWFIQRYNADGSPNGDMTTGIHSEGAVNVMALDNGGWLESWTVGNGDDHYRVIQKTFDADGQLILDTSIDDPIVDFTSGADVSPRTLALAGGGWLTLYTSYNDYDYALAYTADGNPVGVARQLFSHTPSFYSLEAVARPDGGWVLAWRSAISMLETQAFNADGTPATEAMRVAGSDGAFLDAPSLVLTDDNTWVVSYVAQGTTTTSVFERVYAINNDAPTGADKTITMKEEGKYTFSKADFGFSDSNGDHLTDVILTKLPKHGVLMLGDAVVEKGESIAASDLHNLVWMPTKDAFGTDLAELRFKVVDDGGTVHGGKDTSQAANTITFDVTDVTDSFRGDNHANILKGTAGHDILDGGRGDDMLKGRGGSDTFVFAAKYGRDTITDFTASGADHDVIDLSKLNSIWDFSDLTTNHMTSHGAAVWIDDGFGDTLVIRHIEIKDLVKHDFVL